MTAEALAATLRRSPVILLDFDGPVCSVFAGYPASQITDELRGLALDQVGELPSAMSAIASPHEFLSAAAEVSPELGRHVEEALQTAEIKAVESATPTPGVEAFLTACRDAGRQLAIVSNNTGASVRAYLDRVGLTSLVQHIEARDPSDPALMKPSPHLIERAAQALAVEPDACTLIGDQATDVQAARAIGAASIGYANKPGKAADLATAGADAVIAHIGELTEAIRAA
ncbi:HAD family hydrolase [Kribbella soli]|uniref:HAD family phosphatase n=1 Tax=Kribbella soli TaxID=1124743 RepID=A0A4R0HIS5_9ACTN|nr:HAD family phosphatase [Kribbella soli]TCC11267.1 HAD family phosphatase [Kribbella soli]